MHKTLYNVSMGKGGGCGGPGAHARQSDIQEVNSFVGKNKFFGFGARPFVNHNYM